MKLEEQRSSYKEHPNIKGLGNIGALFFNTTPLTRKIIFDHIQTVCFNLVTYYVGKIIENVFFFSGTFVFSKRSFDSSF